MPSEVPAALRDLGAGWSGYQRQLDGLQSAIRKFVTPNITSGILGLDAGAAERLRAQMLDVSGIQAALTASRKPLEKFLQEIRRVTPRNLIGVPLGDQIDLIELSIESRFGLSDTIPPVLLPDLKGLLGERSADVCDYLLDHRLAVLKGCTGTASAMSESVDADAVDHPVLLLRAIDAYLAGYPEAAQALATAVWDSHLTAVWGDKYVTKMKKETRAHEPTHDDSDFEDLYIRADWAPAIRAYAKDGASIYGRNTTSHEASIQQFRAVNGLLAITIATSVLARSYRALLPLPDNS